MGKPFLIIAMVHSFGIRDRRNLDRMRMTYPPTYTPHDNYGTPCEQRISRFMNLSLTGPLLQSKYPVESGEILDITPALGDNLIIFRGKVIHVTPAENEGFDLGISDKDINDPEIAALIRFMFCLQTELR
ncbi:MAG: hypothetical protein GTN74_00565 [Proteobacteria bacterium]|nr:hypothetical protein [Pseudomonadota bacterium]NIS67506.1 hypothetical protein [Pseudomonadota bacterium]